MWRLAQTHPAQQYICGPEDATSSMVAGHCEREGETPRLVGCFSLYPTSFLVASAPAELNTRQPSLPISVLRAALLQPEKLPAMVSHVDCCAGAVLVFLSAWVSKVHWVVLVVLTRETENCWQGTIGSSPRIFCLWCPGNTPSEILNIFDTSDISDTSSEVMGQIR